MWRLALHDVKRFVLFGAARNELGISASSNEHTHINMATRFETKQVLPRAGTALGGPLESTSQVPT
jgi:hypothetical protein